MEAIQKAIAKARKNDDQEHNSVTDTVRAGKTSGNEDIHSQPVNNARESADKESDRHFEYHSTRVVPVSQEELIQRRIHANAKNDVVASIFKMLRSQILLQMRSNDLKTIAVVGATEQVGKSLIASNLAISMALESNQTVMLVDLDLKRPNISQCFGIEKQVEYGIGDYLLENVPLDFLLINPGIERLVILPGRKAYHNSSDIISSKKMRDLITELKNRYQSRIIIFDLPPLLATDDALALMPYFDSSLMVVEDGRNTKDEIKASLKVLSKTHFLGTVLNKGNINKSTYDYQ